MDELIRKLKENPHLALSLPTILCFVQFITSLVTALSDGVIDSTELHQLMASADGFETVVLVVLMFLLKGKK